MREKRVAQVFSDVPEEWTTLVQTKKTIWH